MTDTATLTCANHPDRETTLRCNRCEKPICTSCAVLTPVGYRCKECVRGQQKVFDTGGGMELGIAAVIAAVGIGLAIPVLRILSYWGLLVSPIAGGVISEIIRWGVRRKRNRRMPVAAAIGGAVGVLPHLALPVFNIVAGLMSGLGLATVGAFGFSLLWPVLYGALMIGTLYGRLKSIRF